MWNIIFHISFIQATITLIIKLYKKHFQLNTTLNITKPSSIAHGFFNILTAEMNFTDTHHKKPKRALQTFKFLTHTTDNPLDHFSDNQTNSINNPTVITSPPPFYKKRPNRLHMTRFKLLPKRKQFQHPKTNHRISTIRSSSVQQPTLPNYSKVKTTPNDIIVDNNPVKDDTDSPIKVYSKTTYAFSPPIFYT